jgi:hypothetical protein
VFSQQPSFIEPNEIALLKSELSIPNYIELRKTHTAVSPFGSHTTYSQFINNKKVLFAGARVHRKTNGTLSFQDFLVRENIQKSTLDNSLLLSTKNGLVEVYKIHKEDLVYPTTMFIDANDNILLEKDDFRYIKRDTTIFSKVFYANPINTGNTSYGGNYVDNGDQTNSSLDSQLVWVSNIAKFENGVFYLESDYLKFKDISNPIDAPFSGTNDSFSFTRDNDLFEYVNVYYHINTVGEYVDNLGYTSLTRQLDIDVHSFGGADNSAYDPDNHTLQFGDGGVDDAEDGEVVIHEFTHSLSELASPDNTIGREREAMEEGNCDYFAKAYSRSLNDNTPNKIFSWDGHNPFWDGFELNQKRTYPQDLKGSKDGDRDMWATALMCVHDFIGREAADSLILEHFFYQKANTTMTEMATIILEIDSADFNSRYQSQLTQCFVDAGFIQRKGSNVLPQDAPSPFKVYNQTGFASGEGNLSIDLPNEAQFSIVNSLGQIIIKNQTSSNLVLNPKDFITGLYVLYITIDNSTFTQTIVR